MNTYVKIGESLGDKKAYQYIIVYCSKCNAKFQQWALDNLFTYQKFGLSFLMADTEKEDILRSGICPYCGNDEMKIYVTYK